MIELFIGLSIGVGWAISLGAAMYWLGKNHGWDECKEMYERLEELKNG